MMAEQSRVHVRLVIVALCCGLLVAVMGAVGSTAGLAQRRDEMGGVSVRREGPTRIALDVDYTYAEAHKLPVYAGAWALRAGQRISVGHVPVRLSNWSGTTTIWLESSQGFSGTSDSFEVMLLKESTTEPFLVRRCAFPSTWGTEPPRPYQGPDLVIAQIDVYPETQPKRAHEPFTVQVTVRNSGTTASGAFDLSVQLVDVMRGQVYPRGGARRQPMQPGEQITVYSRQDEVVNNPGFYRVRAEIVPYLFDEPSTCNNIALKGFVIE